MGIEVPLIESTVIDLFVKISILISSLDIREVCIDRIRINLVAIKRQNDSRRKTNSRSNHEAPMCGAIYLRRLFYCCADPSY